MSLFAELQRRSVFKVGAAYLVVAWLVVQAASIAFPTFEAPVWALRVFIFVVMLGFPIALVIAWAVELTPEGLKLETAPTGNKRFFAVTGAIATLAVAWYFLGQPAVREGGEVADSRSVAVLPFVNMSNDPEQEFFSDGIAEELLNRLAQFPDLKVAARTSAFQFKGKNLDVADIGRRLKVAHVLEGSVRKSGTRLRITAQLIDSATGYHLWSQTYERDAADVFKVQDEISTAIANALKAKLGGGAADATPARTVDPAAYDDYLMGRAFFARRTDDNLTQAIAAYGRAIAHDPSYSPAHSGRAFATVIRPFWDNQASLTGALEESSRDVAEALRLDPSNAEAYLVRAVIAVTERRIVAALADIEHAAALAPGSVDVMNFHGDIRGFVADLRGAERLKRQAMALDPLAFIHPLNLGTILASQGRHAEGIALIERALELGGGATARFFLISAHLSAGQVEEAAKVTATQCAEQGAAHWQCGHAQAEMLVARGRSAEVLAAIDALAARNVPGQTPQFRHSSLVWLYAQDPQGIPRATAAMAKLLGAPDWFSIKPLVDHPGGAKLPEEISTDPKWLAAWGDPRIAELMTAYRANLVKFRGGG
jgi:TolB-like protein